MSSSNIVIIYLSGWLFTIWYILPFYFEKGARSPFWLSILWPLVLPTGIFMKIKGSIDGKRHAKILKEEALTARK